MSVVAESPVFAAPQNAEMDAAGWPIREDVFAETFDEADEYPLLTDEDTPEPELDETYWPGETIEPEWADYVGEDANDEYYQHDHTETADEFYEHEPASETDQFEEAGDVEAAEFDTLDEAGLDHEAFPSGLVLTARPGPTSQGEEHWDPNNTGLPLYDTGPNVRKQKLSANFTVAELVTSGGRPADRARISPALVACLQAIRDRAGRPVKIGSGYRSWANNVALYRARGKKPTLSRHCSGQAADITIAGLNGMQIAKLAIDAYGNNIGIGIAKTFAHIDVRGRPDTWTYFTGHQNTTTLNEINQYRANRTTPPTPTPTKTTDRSAGVVRRGTFSKCTGKAQPGASAMAEQWKRLTGRKAGIYNCRQTTFGTPSLHGEGRSIDLYANVNDSAQRVQAEAYIAWLVTNAVELQVAYLIWNRRQWSWKNRAKGWQPYGGSNPHTDHIHVDLSWEGALTPSPLFAGPVPGVGSMSPMPPQPDKPHECTGCSKPHARKLPAHVTAFVEKYRAEAKASEVQSGIPWLVILGQAALESGWGRSMCAPNNLFGIKAKTTMPESKRKLCQTKEVHKSPDVRHYPEVISVTPRPDGQYTYVVRDWFRSYASATEAFSDHAKVLQHKRYAKAFAHKDDPYAFAREVAAGGYATGPDYFKGLSGVMKLIETVPE
ncbi:muramidase (flagellum-specific) [Mycobacterium sp. JS623]|uniref:glucosaminidase domain-containing protein n=1 Tax=Mycobacterium sp. JS623 TaxID=212767 RepID=UPI0002A56C52|nr:glucosaminidase domain-containing protein [Mycobacterium sp. JS623]AGB24074.1 muramidase (flagellum-specific) [Mycobacterium sp. JS623]